MEPASLPLLGEHLDINLTTLALPRNFSKPFGSAEHPPSPQITLHEFRKRQQGPSLAPSPDFHVRPLRRKASSASLSSSVFAAEAREASVVRELPLVQSASSNDILPPLPSLFPTTPQQDGAAASPSLSSTVTTLPSTPTQTPSSHCTDLRTQYSQEERVALVEPLQTKRKYPCTKQYKRLPRRADEAWRVYAAIVDESGGGDGDEFERGPAAGAHASEAPRGGLVGGRRPRAEDGAGGKRDRSVRFAGIWTDSDVGSESLETPEEREHTADSTYTLSKFKFPTPPGYGWAGTFGKTLLPSSPEPERPLR
jgi:hypothetical protein